MYEIETEYLRFLTEISSSLKHNSLLDANSFSKSIIDESYFKPVISNLIERFQILSGYECARLLPHLKNEINDYLQNKNASDEEKLVLNHVFAAISSTISRHSSAKEPTLIVDIRSHLELACDIFKKWENQAKQSVRDFYLDKYENGIKKQITEANHFIDLLRNDIETIETDITKNIQSFFKKIEDLKEKLRVEDSRMLEEKNKLEKALVSKTILSSLKVGCQLLPLLGPKGALAGSILYISLGFAEKAFNNTETKSDTSKIDKVLADNQEYTKNKNSSVLNHTRSQLEKGSTTKKQKPKSDTKTSQKDFQANKNSTLMKNIVDLFDNIQKSKKEIDTLTEVIENNTEKFSKLYDLEKKIGELGNGLRAEISDESNFYKKNYKGQSIAALDFSKWQAKGRLASFKNELFGLINSFDGKDEFHITINRLESAFSTIIDMHSRIETFIQQSEFARFMADITQSQIAIDVPIVYQKQINIMQKILKANVISEMYEKAVEAFKYWSFPFFCEYTRGMIFEVKSNTSNTGHLDHVITTYSRNIEEMLEKIKKSENAIDSSIDNYVQPFAFEGENSFYEWSSKSSPYEIQRLLSGHIATMYADVSQAKFDAIKFCTVYVTIEVKKETDANQTLNRLLQNFYVELKHSGQSNYKFKNKIYDITLGHNSAEKITFRYQYGSTTSDNLNKSLKKLATNKPILSPYTFWEIRIQPIHSRTKDGLLNDIASVLRDGHEIVVALRGKGQYVTEDIKDSNVSCRHKRYARRMQAKESCSIAKIYEAIQRD